MDQIVLSSHSFSEIWIIDHSTSTYQAASHAGGTYTSGGDLLYRWGNPQTYDQGTAADQLLFKQHDADWIADTLTDGGMIMVFNNQAGTPTNYSEVNIIDPPIEATGNYAYTGSAYLPSRFHWTYQAATPTDFYAANISGAQRLANGNTLICEGTVGKLFEVDYAGNTVWEYVSPVAQSGIVAQGNPVSQNVVFRSYRYALDYPGLKGQSLTPQGYIESGSTFTCDLFVTGVHENAQETGMTVYPNPFNNQITITGKLTEWKAIAVYNTLGQNVTAQTTKIWSSENKLQLDFSALKTGMYFIKTATTAHTVYKQ